MKIKEIKRIGKKLSKLNFNNSFILLKLQLN
jgi:hypothetical protein